ncbi:cobalt transporter CbiM [Methanoculleus sp. MH98A]|uniref:cobalt transporter CbiM n=1 Tax=Methanoculleus sp. MH98A TaxID=1495314 RepID=UPI00049F0859|nr:cobalt transporter CbiM [Methanoculleus sp. MH98A]KDE54808.1 cobalamin biosynthesis protein CbiM [Methanoculleus sp. MH98A]
MHISDGVLPMPVIVAGWVITIILLAGTLRWAAKNGDIAREIPKLSVMAGAFFVASLIHIDIPPSSAHLILNGLVGVVLGPLSYLALFIGLTLQALLFQHGGITVIGINTVNVGIPALICYLAFLAGSKRGIPLPAIGGVCGGLGVLLTVVLLVLVLVVSGDQFFAVAGLLAGAHLPIAVAEAIVTGAVVGYLVRVKPELLPIPLKGEKK